MPGGWNLLVPRLGDLDQIGVVAWLIYRLLLLLAGTRAMEMLSGLTLLGVGYSVARLLNLDVLVGLMEHVFRFGAIAALVVFQPELRSALARLGRYRVWGLFTPIAPGQTTDELVRAVEELAANKVGAIVVIEREMPYQDHVEDPGTPLDARVSATLLATIFAPYSPLHDGATVVRGNAIIAAGVILPLTQLPVADRSLGTRHRAALGFSEETDALVLVVSEETGIVSLVHRGILHRPLSSDRLRGLLEGGG